MLADQRAVLVSVGSNLAPGANCQSPFGSKSDASHPLLKLHCLCATASPPLAWSPRCQAGLESSATKSFVRFPLDCSVGAAAISNLSAHSAHRCRKHQVSGPRTEDEDCAVLCPCRLSSVASRGENCESDSCSWALIRTRGAATSSSSRRAASRLLQFIIGRQ